MRILILLAILLFATAVQAQTTVVVELNRAVLSWNWDQGTGGAVNEFLVKCGNAAGTYIKETIVANPAARSIPVKDAITGSGNWFCVVTARNQYGESGPTNEVPFDAGVKPSNPFELKVVAQ